MARIAGNNYSEERCEGEWSDGFYDWYKPIARQIYHEHMRPFDQNPNLDRSDPLYLRGSPTDEYPWGQGIRFPEPVRPLKAKITKAPHDTLGDFVAFIGAISDRVKNQIEKIEPGVHQFFPIDLELPSGVVADQSYWRFCNMNVIDALVLERSDHMQPYYFNKDKWPDFLEYEHDANGPPTLALSREVIAGKAIWFDYKLGKEFFADKLAYWLDDQGIKGWEAYINSVQPTTIIEV